jgi:hypothetical protein
VSVSRALIGRDEEVSPKVTRPASMKQAEDLIVNCLCVEFFDTETNQVALLPEI